MEPWSIQVKLYCNILSICNATVFIEWDIKYWPAYWQLADQSCLLLTEGARQDVCYPAYPVMLASSIASSHCLETFSDCLQWLLCDVKGLNHKLHFLQHFKWAILQTVKFLHLCKWIVHIILLMECSDNSLPGNKCLTCRATSSGSPVNAMRYFSCCSCSLKTVKDFNILKLRELVVASGSTARCKIYWMLHSYNQLASCYCTATMPACLPPVGFVLADPPKESSGWWMFLARHSAEHFAILGSLLWCSRSSQPGPE